jgi:hypothetical protein
MSEESLSSSIPTSNSSVLKSSSANTNNSSTSSFSSSAAAGRLRLRSIPPIDEITISDNSSSESDSEAEDLTILSYKRGRSDSSANSSTATKKSRQEQAEVKKTMIDITEEESPILRDQKWVSIKNLVDQHTGKESSQSNNQTTTSSASATASAEESKSDEEEARSCTICLSPYTDPVVTNCGHLFCQKCLQGWMQQEKTCAVCRKKVNQKQVRRVYW